MPEGITARKPRRPKWVLAVVGGYGLLALTTVAFPWVFFWGSYEDKWWGLAIVTTVWLVALAGLMFVPVQMGRLRRMPRRSIWVPLVVSGFLGGMLAFGAGLALWELTEFQKSNDAILWAIVLAGAGVWAMWAGLFYLMTRRQGRARVAMTLHRWLFAGTVLELLVAVPSHIIVRRRGECCAGMYTGAAICIGVAIVVLAFGPGVVLLYVRRFKQIQLPPPEEGRGFEVEAEKNAPAEG